MSAFVVSDQEIHMILSAAVDIGLCSALENAGDEEAAVTRENATRFGRMLLAENVRSVVALYRIGGTIEHDGYRQRIEDYRFHYVEGVTPAGLVRLCQYTEYQSCETDDFESTPAAVFYRNAIAAVRTAGRCPSASALEALPWGVGRAADLLAFLTATAGAN